MKSQESVGEVDDPVDRGIEGRALVVLLKDSSPNVPERVVEDYTGLRGRGVFRVGRCEKKVSLEVVIKANAVETVELITGSESDGAVSVNVRDVVAWFIRFASAPAEVAGLRELGRTAFEGGDVHGVQLPVRVQGLEPDAELIGEQIAGELAEVICVRAYPSGVDVDAPVLKTGT